MWRLSIPAFIINLSLTLGCLLASAQNSPAQEIVSRYKPQYNIGSFNIQSFGKYKIAQPDVRPYLTKILKRYDIMLIQEIRDKSETAIYILLEDLKKSTGRDYGIKLSKRLGSGSHKEQLAYIYDKTMFKITFASSPRDENDEFYREPYVAKVTHKRSSETFVMVGAHLSPKFVIKELEGIAGVVEQVYDKFDIDRILIMGDLNADCDYITKPNLANNSLRASEFTWWIDDDADTTSSYGTNCAYDRIITTTEMDDFIASPASVYNFQIPFRLTREQTLRISDHYPVEIKVSF